MPLCTGSCGTVTTRHDAPPTLPWSEYRPPPCPRLAALTCTGPSRHVSAEGVNPPVYASLSMSVITPGGGGGYAVLPQTIECGATRQPASPTHHACTPPWPSTAGTASGVATALTNAPNARNVTFTAAPRCAPVRAAGFGAAAGGARHATHAGGRPWHRAPAASAVSVVPSVARTHSLTPQTPLAGARASRYYRVYRLSAAPPFGIFGTS